MAKLRIRIGKKDHELNLTSVKITPKNFISYVAWFCVLLFAAVVFVSRLILPQYSDASAVVIFYGLAIVLLVDMIIRYVTKQSTRIVENDLIIPTILFVIINLALTLLPTHKGGLVEVSATYNSPLTLMAAVIVTYYLSLVSTTRLHRQRVLSAIVGGISLLNVLILFFQELSSFYPVVFWFIPWSLVRAINARSIGKRYFWVVNFLIGLLNLWVYLRGGSYKELLVALVAGLLYALFCTVIHFRQKFKQLKHDYGILKPTRSSWADFLRTHPIILVAGLNVVMLLVLLASRNNINITNDFLALNKYVAVSETLRVLAGYSPVSTADFPPFFMQIFSSGGLAGIVTFLGISLFGVWHLIRNAKSYRRMQFMFLTSVLVLWFVWSIYVYTPVAIYLAWWIWWAVIAIEVEPAKEKSKS